MPDDGVPEEPRRVEAGCITAELRDSSVPNRFWNLRVRVQSRERVLAAFQVLQQRAMREPPGQRDSAR